MKRAVVTGGAGFIGSHVAQGLVSAGAEVLIIDDFSTGRSENIEALQRETGRSVSVLKADINDESVPKAIAEFRPEAICHLAAQANVRKSVQDPRFDARANVLGTIALLEAARESGVRAFVFSSTGGAIYGEQESFPAGEDHPTRPECPYGVSKRSGELYLEYAARTYGFRGVTLRYANVYGPRQNPKGEAGVVAVFAERLLQGKHLVVNGDGDQTRDFVFVDDVVRANLSAVQAILLGKMTRPYSVFNVGCGTETSVNDIVQVLRRIWPELAGAAGMRGGEFEVEHAAAAAGEQRRSVVDASTIARELGWRPEVQFAEGMERTMKSFLHKSACGC